EQVRVADRIAGVRIGEPESLERAGRHRVPGVAAVDRAVQLAVARLVRDSEPVQVAGEEDVHRGRTAATGGGRAREGRAAREAVATVRRGEKRAVLQEEEADAAGRARDR